MSGSVLGTFRLFDSFITKLHFPRRLVTMASTKRYVGTTERGLTRDFSVPVPWGEVAGKTWGDENGPPILCLHGWLDNCNTFDKLIPLLPQGVGPYCNNSGLLCPLSGIKGHVHCRLGLLFLLLENFYIAFDTPGHGLSSAFPTGMYYFTIAYSSVIKRVIDYFKLNKITILGHSMGGNVGAYFGGVYPEITKRLIIIDAIGLWFRMKDEMVSSVRACIDTHLSMEYAEAKPEKTYTYEQAKERLKSANKNLTDEAVEVLLERGMKENEDGYFTFRRDMRHLLNSPNERSFETALQFVEKNNADVLQIVAKSGLAKMIATKYEKEFQLVHDTYKTHSKSFQLLEAEGNHHLHLCTPENVAKLITDFLLAHPIDETMGSGRL